MPTTPNLALTYIATAQAQKEVTHNDALNDIDALAQISVISRTLSTPPVSPANGDVYIVGASPTGAWAGQTNSIAAYYSGWKFKTPKTGWCAYSVADAAYYLFNGTAWVAYVQTFAGGSAAAPSITFTGDSDTGIYSPGANQLALATNGAQRLTADANGSVVVGTGALTTTATAGFLYIASCPGAPTGVPTAYTGRTPLVYDSTNGRMKYHTGSLWGTLASEFTLTNFAAVNVTATNVPANGVNLPTTNTLGVLTASLERMRVDASGNVVVNTAALATTATNGFLYIPTCAGAPTGVPTAYTGRVPMVYDTTNNKFWIYNGAWKGVVLA